MDFNTILKSHQLIAKNFIETRPAAGLFLDCGAGKTLSTLASLYELNEPYHILVVAPKAIAVSTWKKEIKKWGDIFPYTSLIVNEKDKNYSTKIRHQLYQNVLDCSKATVFSINRENFVDLVLNLPENKYGQRVWPFGTVVFDELQSFKSHTSQRMKALQTVRPYMNRVIGLTGTPTPNGLMDLWGEIYALDQGARLGQTITAYRNTFFYPIKYIKNRPVDWAPFPGAKEEIYRRISDIIVSIDTDGLDLPDLIVNDISVHLSPAERKLYDRLRIDKVLEFDGVTITAKQAAGLQQKLSQLASGALYVSKDSKEYIKVHEEKLDICEYIIDNTSSPVLIAYHFKSDLDMLQERFPYGVQITTSSQIQDDWNAGKIPLAFIQPKSCGLGLNLQSGPGHTLVWYTLDFNYEDYYQMNKRLYRPGQTMPVTIHRLITENTIDERVAKALERKEADEQELIDAVKWALQTN